MKTKTPEKEASLAGGFLDEPWTPPGGGNIAPGEITHQFHADVVLLDLGVRGGREFPPRADVRGVALRGELRVERLAEADGGHDAHLGREVAHHSQGLRAAGIH